MTASDTGDQQPQKQSHGKRLTMVSYTAEAVLKSIYNLILGFGVLQLWAKFQTINLLHFKLFEFKISSVEGHR